MTVHMLNTFALFKIEDTLENRLSFLTSAKELWMKDPVLGSPQNMYNQIAITILINELNVELALQNKNL